MVLIFVQLGDSNILVDIYTTTQVFLLREFCLVCNSVLIGVLPTFSWEELATVLD